ncbi:MAG: amino acid adenylation domain-containing protein, partial [Pseudomonadota bacterium]
MDDRIAALRERVARLDPDQREAFRRKVEASGLPWERIAPASERTPRPERCPLSPAQLQFWLTQSVYPSSCAFTIAFAWDCDGPLDVEALQAALEHVVARHDPLRSAFPSEDGQPWHVVSAHGHVPLEKTPLPDDPDKAEREFVGRPFDLSRPPLWRIQLQTDGLHKHRLLFAFHHMIADGWSRGVFLRELSLAYRTCIAGDVPSDPPIEWTFVDALLERRNWLETPEAGADAAFWKETLCGLSAQNVSIEASTSDRSACTIQEQFPAALARKIEPFARNLGVSPFVLLLAVFQLLLHRQTGSDDIAVGTPVAGRNIDREGGLIGLFVNTLVLRNQPVPGEAFRAWVSRVGEGFSKAFEHQGLPFARVVEVTGVKRRADQTPLFQTLFQVQTGYSQQNADEIDLGVPDLLVRQRLIPLPEAKFDLTWHVVARDDDYGVIVEYREALFSHRRITHLIEHFQTLLEAAERTPDAPIEALKFVPNGRSRECVVSGERRDIPDLLNLIQAQSGSDETALVSTMDGEALSFRDVWSSAGRLARRLCARPELKGATARVGICLDRGPNMVIAILAALRAGIAYVPLDPDHPEARLAGILDDAQVGLLIADDYEDSFAVPAVSIDDLLAQSEEEALPARYPERLAYLIFTSGSTGRPKGVSISHSAFSNLIASMRERPGLSRGDRFLAVTTIAFDIAALELLLPFASGATLVLADKRVTQDPVELARALELHEITHMQATPALWRILIESGWSGRGTLTALSGGEALSSDLARRLLHRVGALWNMYGPTETTIWSAALNVQPEHLEQSTIPIGGVVANTSLAIVDRYGQPLPSGLPGDLCIGGAGLSSGYWQRPDLTGERFITLRGERFYRTGDIAVLSHDETFRFLGRSDYQIKLNGFRIEPAEIEAALLGHSEIAEALVMLFGEQLVAFVRGTAVSLERDQLLDFLSQQLPTYMLPSRFIWLDAFPLNTNGKVDRSRLPIPDLSSNTVGRGPRSDEESILQRLWSEVLDRKDIGLDENFFDLGGASISAIQIASRAKSEGLTLTPAQMFEHQTIATQALAAHWIERDRNWPLSPWQVGSVQSDRRAWCLRVLLPDDPKVELDRAMDAVQSVHPGLRFVREGEVWVENRGTRALHAQIDGRSLRVRCNASLVDGSSIARLTADLVAALSGRVMESAEDDGYLGWLKSPRQQLPSDLHPLEKEQPDDANEAPIGQSIGRELLVLLRERAHRSGESVSHLLAAEILAALTAWKRAPGSLVLIEEATSSSIGNFLRALPLS